MVVDEVDAAVLVPAGGAAVAWAGQHKLGFDTYKKNVLIFQMCMCIMVHAHMFSYPMKITDMHPIYPGEFWSSSTGDKVIEIIETWRVISSLQNE